MEADDETRLAIEGYRDAMTYVLQAAAAHPMPKLDGSVVKALHFMMLKYDLAKHPGQFRPGSIWVENQDGEPVYEAPERAEVDALVAQTIEAANQDDAHPTVRAAMTHLNLALVHPFSDGNGRMARALQSYVLASEGPLSPEFLSIEEYLGRNTRAYYDVLAEVAQGEWSPHRDARPWLQFSLTAHVRQAHTLLRRIQEAEALWDRCEQLVRTHGLPDRCTGALCDSSRGWKLRRSLYVKTVRSSTSEVITDDTATRDLAAMVRAQLLDPIGQKRGRTYQATDSLRHAWAEIREQRPRRPEIDPYDGAHPTLHYALGC